VTDRSELRTVADCFESKYGPHFTSPNGTWGPGSAMPSEAATCWYSRVDPSTAFGFGKALSSARPGGDSSERSRGDTTMIQP
jgi:hypothetical protein